MEPLRLRLICFQLFLILLFSLLVARFYFIQIDEGEIWQKIARRQHYFMIQEPALRGSFLANNTLKRGKAAEAPKKFVVEIEKFHLHIDPNSLPEAQKKEIKETLIAYLQLPLKLHDNFSQQFKRKSRNRKLATWLDKDVKEKIYAWWRPFAKKYKIPHNALFFVSDYKRSYPFHTLLGQLLHTTRGARTANDGQSIPTGGLELHFDKYLKGRPGKRRLMRSPRNSLEIGEVIVAPERGADIYLTIDHYLQSIVEKELEKGVKRCYAKAGRAVMMHPNTGEILAIAHYPSFDPSRYQRYFNHPELLLNTQLGAVTDAIEPGSVMKPFTVCAALMANQELIKRGEAPLFDPEEKMATSDGRFPGRSRPLVDTRLHRFMNLPMAVQKSANIYLARLVEKIIARLGSSWYRSSIYEPFGFGKKSGIEFPAESPGLLPRIGKSYSNGALEWSTSTPFSLAMGYNLQLNAIQLVRGYAAIANGGILVEPTFVRRIVATSEKGEEIVYVDNTTEERQKRFPRVISREIADEVVNLMKYTTKPFGSASKAEVYGYTEAGKSGTAKQVINGSYEDVYYSSFVGFAPAKNPAFVLLVTMVEPTFGYVPGIGKRHHGGACAAPVFGKIAKRSLAYLEVAPDDPYGYPNGDPRADHSKADWLPEVNNLKQLYDTWNE